MRVRVQELCESRGGRPGLLSLIVLGRCRRKAEEEEEEEEEVFRSRVKVEVAVLGRSLIVRMVSVDGKQH